MNFHRWPWIVEPAPVEGDRLDASRYRKLRKMAFSNRALAATVAAGKFDCMETEEQFGAAVDKLGDGTLFGSLEFNLNQEGV